MTWWKAWIEQEGISVMGSPHFNPDPNMETLYKTMKRIGEWISEALPQECSFIRPPGEVEMLTLCTPAGTNINVLTRRSNVYWPQIAESFKAQLGKDLTETLKSEVSGNFENVIVALMYPPNRYEAKELCDAMKGLGIKEGIIIKILAFQTKNQLQEIMKAYERYYGSSLEEDIQADTISYLERILVCLLWGSRDDVSSFGPGLALQDAQYLYAVGKKIHSTDEMKFITILCMCSATHLMRVFKEYEKITNKSIEDSIKSETHSLLKEAMLTVAFLLAVKCTQNLHSYFVERFYYAMKGVGTSGGTLIRNIVSRSEIDLNLIKDQFQKMNSKTISSMIMVNHEFPILTPV
ncbi:LOW QUALITY PROTEIN: annexin A8-like [Glossophaga mutica]